MTCNQEQNSMTFQLPILSGMSEENGHHVNMVYSSGVKLIQYRVTVAAGFHSKQARTHLIQIGCVSFQPSKSTPDLDHSGPLLDQFDTNDQ